MSTLAERIAAMGRPGARREALPPGSGTHPGAVAAALGLHGLAVAAALFAADRVPPPAPETPVLDLSLAFPSPAAPTAAEAARPAAETFPEEEPLAPAAELEPAPEPPPPASPQETAAPPVEPPPEPFREVAALPELPPPEPPEPEPPPREVAALPEPPPPPPAVQPRAQRPSPRPPRSAPAAEARSGAPAAQAPAESDPPAADPVAAAAGLAEYRAALLRILRANHRYPRAAEVRGDEGTVLVRFAVARDGRVLSPRVQRGSGHPVLDEEAEALLRRVSPLPPLPAAVPQAQLELLVPITFRIR